VLDSLSCASDYEHGTNATDEDAALSQYKKSLCDDDDEEEFEDGNCEANDGDTGDESSGDDSFDNI
jgi:hypothetical protein